MTRYWISLGSAALLAMVAACGGSDGKATAATEPAPAAEPAKPAEPVVLTQEQKIEAYQACFGHFLAKDKASLKGCYAPEGVHEFVDSGEASATGPDASVDGVEPFWNAFPDIAGEMRLVLVNGSNFAGVYGVWATMTGDMMGMKATNNPIGMVNLETMEVNDEGKAVRHREYINMGLFYAQVTGDKAPHRAPIGASGAEPMVVVATDSDAEKANVEAFKKSIEVWNARDWKTFQAGLAKDIVWSDQMLPADIKGAAKVMAFHKEIAGAFKDGKLEATNVWAAGDYVYADMEFAGTNTGPLKALGLKKKTGKPVAFHLAFVAKMVEGKTTEFWVFANGQALAMQLGLIPAPAAPAEG